jgi:hypothetical protein
MSRAEAEVRKQAKIRKTAAPRAPRVPRGKKATAETVPVAVRPQNHMIGLAPRVDLLPTEVHVDRRERAVTRRAWLGVVVVGALVVLATGAAYTVSARSATELSSSQSATAALLREEQSFNEVKQVQQATSLIRAGQAVGGSTEIDWGTYLDRVQASLPTGVTITGVSIDSASALATYTQATAPLQGSRIATLTFTASSPTLPSIPVWLDALKTLPGYTDANANSVTLATDSSSGYTANITIHINTAAYDDKYVPKKGK